MLKKQDSERRRKFAQDDEQRQVEQKAILDAKLKQEREALESRLKQESEARKSLERQVQDLKQRETDLTKKISFQMP